MGEQVAQGGRSDSAAAPEIVELPVIPLRGLTLFPKGLVPLTVARPASVRALQAIDDSRRVIVVCQRDPQVESPVLSDLHSIGTIAVVLRTSAVPKNESVLVAFVEGQSRVALIAEIQREPYLRVRGRVLVDIAPGPARELAGLDRSIRDLFHEIVTDSPNLPDELLALADKIAEPSALVDFVAQSLASLAAETRQKLLEQLDVRARMRRLMEELVRIREEQQIGQRLRAEVQEKITERQRELVLREQLKAIRRELGEEDEGARELAELRARVAEANLPAEAAEAADRELQRLERMPPMSPEITVGRTYLEWLADLPWQRSSGGAVDLARAARILDEDHYGLEKIKQRILEYLAVFELKPDLKPPILCLVGAPGVGKTSVGKSIARAMGRKFVRISLGGMHDEAELRGHRRTYIGALPGQIIQSLRRAGVNDPVFMLDEVDKLGRDFRGDPASALLEVLDPEQNSTFRDRYLEVPFDLSRILFVTTANYLDPIPAPLLDRMEILELAGYIDEEKLEIAKRYLIPRQVAEHGLALGTHIAFEEGAVMEVVRRYTREAGVRLLQQKIAAICRKRAKQIAAGGDGRLVVTRDVVHEMLGAPRFRAETEIEERTRRPGVAVALAWTPAGGEILFVEASRMARGRGEFAITGQIRPVMQESAQAALSWVRANLDEYGCDPADFRRYDIHIHIPSGAVPKDGPSAGIVMVVALASLFMNRPIRPHLAMTGEITLSGLVLPVGGIKEKVLAAKRNGVAEIILPAQNRPDVVEDIPEHLREGLQFHFVKTIPEVLSLAFAGMRAEGAHRRGEEERPPWERPSPPIA